MRGSLRILAPVLCAALGACSGVIAVPGYVQTVRPEYLRQYARGGSLSTLWYEGSDARFHYFSHSFKARSRYRIRRDALHWHHEFPRGSRSPVYCSPDFLRLPAASP